MVCAVCDVATRLAYCRAGRAVYKGRHVGVQCSRQLLSVGLYTSDVTSVRACVLCVLCCTGVAMSTTNPDPYGLRQVSDVTRPTGSVLALMTRDLCTATAQLLARPAASKQQLKVGLFLFYDFCQTNWIRIYRTDFHQICRVCRTMAVDDHRLIWN